MDAACCLDASYIPWYTLLVCYQEPVFCIPGTGTLYEYSYDEYRVILFPPSFSRGLVFLFYFPLPFLIQLFPSSFSRCLVLRLASSYRTWHLLWAQTWAQLFVVMSLWETTTGI